MWVFLRKRLAERRCKKMNICVIGLGSMGRRRIRLLKEIVPDAVILGMDSNLQRVETVSREYGIRCFSSAEGLEKPLDCAFVCTSPQFHAGIIEEYLQKGCHIFSEINLINDKYHENIRLAKKQEKVLFLSSTSLYKQEIQYIDTKVKKNGNPCVYQYHIGQYLPNWHPWDNLKDFFVSNKITNGCREYLAIELPWIQHTFGKIKTVRTVKRNMSNLALDFPDTYLIQLEHENGCAGNLLVDVVSRQAIKHLEVINEDIYLKWEGTPDSLYEKDLISGELRKIEIGEYVHTQGYAGFVNEYAYKEEIEDFFAVIEGKKPIYDFEKDKETLRLIDEIEG